MLLRMSGGVFSTHGEEKYEQNFSRNNWKGEETS
jgi:hypothetical protein